ncbi:hydroxyethylthiazole kinase [Luteipulveratus flavus]|uniref:Hydroxyethylthiazole kinase n=1 Tax=Luteipulveratus flavus TaxID=3031728 RepID=A0ABT6CAE4_9MICO|nr:hydroxyethylthiazole kinase [Luteipulveratus sp. YIM 133296]MDF8265765.1 hydroxyethylthiazole kinase [Luteipulveratus sp. YIM 133296]
MASPRAADLADALASMRRQQPLTHCLTNIVAAPWTANVLLAAGAAPAMVDNAHEAAGFTQVASAVLVNLGTPYDDTSAAMRVAASAAAEHGTPWVLDPVAVGGLPWRTELAAELLDARPAVVRGNASEVLALGGGGGGRGVDSTDDPAAAMDAARALAGEHGCVVAVSGPVDHLTDGDTIVRVANGHEWLTRVTGVGCALGALMAAYAGSVDDRLTAAVAATAHLTVAADVAAETTRGPGSFAVSLLDELAILMPRTLAERVRLS